MDRRDIIVNRTLHALHPGYRSGLRTDLNCELGRHGLAKAKLGLFVIYAFSTRFYNLVVLGSAPTVIQKSEYSARYEFMLTCFFY